MCGIFGCFLNRPLTPDDIDLCRRGLEMQAHRGPDDSGEWIDAQNGIFFGHRRLSIIDLSKGSAQPMRHGQSVITYNGEIYNFRQLRKELEARGETFASTGDTEVLLKGFQALGPALFDRLDGMFAFAFWDGARGHLCVDAFSEKPLYWIETPDGVFFSSELTPIATLLRPELDIAEQSLAAFLALGYIPPPATPYHNVFRMQSASHIVIERGAVASKTRYWEMPFGQAGAGAPPEPDAAVRDRCRQVLVESVENRLVADVPVCLFLSSGVDSSLVAALASRELGVKLPAVTLAFRNSEAPDESRRASDIAKHLGLPHTLLVSDLSQEGLDVPLFLDLIGQPNEVLTALPYYTIAQEAKKQGFPVALSGSGSDEVFLGYAKHAFVYDHKRFYNMPAALRRAIGLATRLFPSHKGEVFSSLFDVADEELYIALKNNPAVHWLRSLGAFRSWARQEFGRFAGRQEIQIPRYELVSNMPNGHLHIFDHSTMRASLELRTPFLNRKLVECIAEYDPRMFFASGQKDFLRSLLAEYLPTELFDHSKIGFALPNERLLREYAHGFERIPHLAKGQIDALMARKLGDFGWRKIAVRLVLLNEFIRTRHAA